jgi:DNA-binding NarL/FixJ family response regulator
MHIALCDDHALVADGIALLLRTLDPQIRVTTYHSAEAMLAAVPGWSDVGLVLLDLALPDAQGMDGITRLRALRDDLAIVVLSGLSDRATVLRALDAGAMGFIPKSAPTQLMTQALRVVAQGGIFVPDVAIGVIASRAGGQRPSLTRRQWDVLYAVLQGKPNKRIARDLDIAESTVKTHVSTILQELGVTTRTEAIVKAMQLGLDFSGVSRPK